MPLHLGGNVGPLEPTADGVLFGKVGLDIVLGVVLLDGIQATGGDN
jgi:hypothetical protein